jgi:hypothetical protein
MLAGYVCVMCLLGILFTGSRGGYIAAAVGLMIFVLLSLVMVGKLASGRVLGVTLAGVILIAGGTWGVRKVMAHSALVQIRADQTLTVDVVRMRLWQAAWKQFRLQPVVGTGSGTYLYYGRQFRHPAVHTDPVHAHNDYFELLAEYGILGIITAVIFLETHVRHGWNSFTGRLSRGIELQGVGSNSLALTVGALSAAAACVVHSLLDFNLHMPANVLTAAFLFGLLAAPGEGSEMKVSEDHPGYPAFLRLVLPALGILIVCRLAPTAPAEYYAERTRAILSDWHRSASVELDLEMESLARRGLTWDPHNPELHFALAEAQSAQGGLVSDPQAKAAFYTQAAESYRKALENAPGDVRFMLTLAGALDTLERFSEADPLYARALVLDPNGGTTHNDFAVHLLAQDKFAEAVEQFRLGEKFGAAEFAQYALRAIDTELKSRAAAKASPASDAPNPK